MVATRIEYLTVETVLRSHLQGAIVGDEVPCIGHLINNVLHHLIVPQLVQVHPPPEEAAEGRGMRAVRPVNQSELVFSAEASFVFINPSARKRVCCRCHGVGPRRLERVCRLCRLAHYCSAGCEAHDRHAHRRVCHLLPLIPKFRLKKSGKTSSRGILAVDHEVFQKVLAFLLEARSHDLALDRLCHLQSDPGGWSEGEQETFHSIADFVVEFLQEHLSDDEVLAAVTSEDVRHILSRSQLNAFGLSSMGKEGQDMGLLMFTEMSFFNHSCAPNTVMEVVDDCQYLFARRPIPVGEEVCTHYITLDSPLAIRRKKLSDSFDFICRCSRCVLEEAATPKARKEKKGGYK